MRERALWFVPSGGPLGHARSRRAWGAVLLGCAALFLLVLLLLVPAAALSLRAWRSPLDARAASGSAPQLGRAYTRGVSGFGRVRPARIFLGGDPTGLVEHIHWSGWGAASALGEGYAEYDWPGTPVAGNGVSSAARVVAFHLGSCRGHRSYNALEWYFPEDGQLFNPHKYINTCTGEFVGAAVNPISCSTNIQLKDGAGMVTSVLVSGISCQAASRLIAEAPAADYLPGGGRFIQGGFRCGTEGARWGPPIFACEKGTQDSPTRSNRDRGLRACASRRRGGSTSGSAHVANRCPLR